MADPAGLSAAVLVGSYEVSNVPVLTVSIISKKRVLVARRGVSVYRLGHW